MHDNFFAAGGHLLKAMTLCGRMLKEMDLDVPVGLLFSKPTIADLAPCLASAPSAGQWAYLDLPVWHKLGILCLCSSGSHASSVIFLFH
ncbi:phosphopantetheine-binding protein [Paenibacillus farraposensis]|uniref:Phosphopantetheine-binding protein n=1 Tax=Paenibacillus farraposensis TaxID=2807095 RepID=A0ABW4DC37_9BACL